MAEILLTEGEMGWIAHLASLRNIVAVRTRKNDYRIASLPGIEADTQGMMGEYAFCKWRNVFLDIIPKDPGGCDGIINGKRFDIKATDHPTGRLMVNLKDNPNVDLYILAIVNREKQKVKFAGWAWKSDVCKPENICTLTFNNGAKKDVYALDQSQLKTTWDKAKPTPTETINTLGEYEF